MILWDEEEAVSATVLFVKRHSELICWSVK
jgi:hypothetical protein